MYTVTCKLTYDTFDKTHIIQKSKTYLNIHVMYLQVKTVYWYPQLDHLDLYYKVNNREVTFKLLSTIRIVGILEKNMIDVQCIDTVMNMLPLPHQLFVAIHDESEYQRDLYFTSFVEPTITYTYPNELIIHHNYSWY